MKFLEKDLEEIIYNSDKNQLSNRGLYIHGVLKRQLRIGNYGVADLVSFERPYFHPEFKTTFKGTITVFELKQDKIGVSTFFQALNYIKGIKHWISLNRPSFDDCFNFNIVLIGSSFDGNSSFVYLGDFFDVELGETHIDDSVKTRIELYKYKYDLDGLSFVELHNYCLSNHGLKKPESTPF